MANDIINVVADLTSEYGEGWSFEVISHLRLGDSVEVVGEVRANGSSARETG
ncbi:MAG: hypothetical protein HOI95_29695, partial [Chromatiales bacterium]|nr:hypothetical protein [Chromatiales bacterium]